MVMFRFCSLFVLGAVLGVPTAIATIELPDLPYGDSDLEPYISSEVSGPWRVLSRDGLLCRAVVCWSPMDSSSNTAATAVL